VRLWPSARGAPALSTRQRLRHLRRHGLPSLPSAWLAHLASLA